MTQRFPLAWPAQRPRTPERRRKLGQFSGNGRPITLAGATARLGAELRRIDAPDWDWIISTNLELRRSDGMPKSGQPIPRDPGVAVYFKQKDGTPVCLPCDTYSSVEQNVAAIANHIAATRAIERYGVASIREMFSGFTAIAAPGSKHWTAVLGLDLTATPDRIKSAHMLLYKQVSGMAHPESAQAEINAARDQALKERSP